MKSLVLLLTTYTGLVSCLPPPHPDVLAVRQEEEHLHTSLKSPALRNPHLLKILPLTSLLHEGEKLVFERATNDVPRHEIYKILTHSGLIPRKVRFPTIETLHHNQNEIPIIFPEEQINFQDLSYFPSQDALQYL